MMKIKEITLRDRIILPAASGVLGTLVMYCVGIPLYFLNVSKAIYLSYVAELFITRQLTQTIPGFIFGFLTGIIAGSILALGFKLVVEWTGSDWIWIKAVGYGAFIWLVWVGIARNLMNITPYLHKDIASNAVLLGQSIIFTLATTYFMIKLSGGKQYIEKGEDK